jgi:hypothetical protein
MRAPLGACHFGDWGLSEFGGGQSSETFCVLAKSLAQLLHDHIKFDRVRSVHGFGTQFADAIFKATVFHGLRRPSARGNFKDDHIFGGLVRYSAHRRD